MMPKYGFHADSQLHSMYMTNMSYKSPYFSKCGLEFYNVIKLLIRILKNEDARA